MKNIKSWIAVFTVLCLMAMPFAALAETLKRGSAGEDVEQIQEWLTELGYLDDKVDEKEIKKLEEQIDALEKELAELDEVMANPTTHPDVKVDDNFYWNYGKKKEELQYLIDKWGELAM